jgi:hypothetical protein
MREKTSALSNRSAKVTPHSLNAIRTFLGQQAKNPLSRFALYRSSSILYGAVFFNEATRDRLPVAAPSSHNKLHCTKKNVIVEK